MKTYEPTDVRANWTDAEKNFFVATMIEARFMGLILEDKELEKIYSIDFNISAKDAANFCSHFYDLELVKSVSYAPSPAHFKVDLLDGNTLLYDEDMKKL